MTCVKLHLCGPGPSSSAWSTDSNSMASSLILSLLDFSSKPRPFLLLAFSLSLETPSKINYIS